MGSKQCPKCDSTIMRGFWESLDKCPGCGADWGVGPDAARRTARKVILLALACALCSFIPVVGFLFGIGALGLGFLTFRSGKRATGIATMVLGVVIGIAGQPVLTYWGYGQLRGRLCTSDFNTLSNSIRAYRATTHHYPHSLKDMAAANLRAPTKCFLGGGDYFYMSPEESQAPVATTNPASQPTTQATTPPTSQGTDDKTLLEGAANVRREHPSGGLAMWNTLAKFVQPGMTAHQMKLVLPPIDPKVSLEGGKVNTHVGNVGWDGSFFYISYWVDTACELRATAHRKPLDECKHADTLPDQTSEEDMVLIESPTITTTAPATQVATTPAIEMVTKIYWPRALLRAVPDCFKPAESGASEDTLTSRLIRCIETRIDPKSWERYGGKGKISETSGCLVVTQTEENHRAIAAFIPAAVDPPGTTTAPTACTNPAVSQPTAYQGDAKTLMVAQLAQHHGVLNCITSDLVVRTIPEDQFAQLLKCPQNRRFAAELDQAYCASTQPATQPADDAPAPR